MPQKKYDLRNQFEKSARRYGNEEERLTQLQTVIDAHHKQTQMPKKYKLPTFDCPACHAKNIMFAGDAVAKNETILTLFEENGVPDLAETTSLRDSTQTSTFRLITSAILPLPTVLTATRERARSRLSSTSSTRCTRDRHLRKSRRLCTPNLWAVLITLLTLPSGI